MSEEVINHVEPQEPTTQVDNSSILKEYEEKMKALEEENKALKVQKEQSKSTADKMYEKHKSEDDAKNNSFEINQIKAFDEISEVKNLLERSNHNKLLEVFNEENNHLKEKNIDLLTRLESSKIETVKYWLKDNEDRLITNEEKKAYIDLQNKNKDGFQTLWNVFIRELELKKQTIAKERNMINKIREPKTSMDKYESTFFKGIKRVKTYEGGAYVSN